MALADRQKDERDELQRLHRASEAQKAEGRAKDDERMRAGNTPEYAPYTLGERFRAQAAASQARAKKEARDKEQDKGKVRNAFERERER